MTSTLGSVVLQVSELDRAAAFWSQALGYVASPHNPAFLASPDGSGTRLHLDEDDRTHLDLWTVESSDLETEVTRLVALGARRAEWTYPEDADFVVLEDTEGNFFCVIDTS
jgi:catechol 2,3-dioxygenase-like lactoylglutathione lyase family enzyme